MAELLVECVDRTGSTQSDLAGRARDRASPVPVLRSALHQDAGRGRMGRSWLDEPGGSLLFSLCLPWSLPAAMTPAVTLACGCALADIIDAAIDASMDAARDEPRSPRPRARVAIKWPNDLLLGEAKLAGILVELVQDPQGRASLVIGVGCNLALGVGARERIEQAATDLASVLGREAALRLRESLLRDFAQALIAACEGFTREGFDRFREGFLARMAFRGERVCLVDEQRELRCGSLLGVDAHGRLMLGTASGIETASGGELRREEAR